MMRTPWMVTNKGDPVARALADRHYSRQKPGSKQFVSGCRYLALLTRCHRAVWVTKWPAFARHRWTGAWECQIFRNEGAGLSSAMIRDAVAATRWYWRDETVPVHGMITFVDAGAVRPKANPGRCFLEAGFVLLDERTKVHGRLVLQMLPGVMPEPCAPRGVRLAPKGMQQGFAL